MGTLIQKVDSDELKFENSNENVQRDTQKNISSGYGLLHLNSPTRLALELNELCGKIWKGVD